jgi:uncharacterized protein
VTNQASTAKENGPSFDCSKVTNPTAIAICGDAGLIALDRQMAALYYATDYATDASTRAGQRQWIQQRNTICGSGAGCLRARFNEPITQLQQVSQLASNTPQGARSPPAQAPQTTVPLGQLISTLLVPADSGLGWSLSAGTSSPIHWSTNGIDSTDCGRYTSCRHGDVRVSIDGKEMTELGAKVEPLRWRISIWSTAPGKFDPERVNLDPNCNTVACAFSLGNELQSAGFSAQQVCRNQGINVHVVGYRISKGALTAFLAYFSNEGSGGESNDIDLVLSPKVTKTEVCRL